jgi:hypothetical protein
MLPISKGSGSILFAVDRTTKNTNRPNNQVSEVQLFLVLEVGGGKTREKRTLVNDGGSASDHEPTGLHGRKQRGGGAVRRSGPRHAVTGDSATARDRTGRRDGHCPHPADAFSIRKRSEGHFDNGMASSPVQIHLDLGRGPLLGLDRPLDHPLIYPRAQADHTVEARASPGARRSILLRVTVSTGIRSRSVRPLDMFRKE